MLKKNSPSSKLYNFKTILLNVNSDVEYILLCMIIIRARIYKQSINVKYVHTFYAHKKSKILK